ncbi:MAG: DUF3494 domain-containing protein [Burkholderiales bacterium]|nr:DUF3494 domain-containing protein [Burkholderiales bacterium]
MNDLQKHLSMGLLATVALLVGASPAWAQVSLGTASNYAVLGGTTVTTSASTVNGDLGSGGALTLTGSAINGNVVYSGALVNTGSTISGTATTPLNPQVITDLNSAWTSVQSLSCDVTLAATIAGPVTLAPGVYCTDTALTGAGVLTLDAGGDANAVWIFKIGAALTGTGFSVVMANGGQPCNVFWVPGADVTMTTSAFSGNILAGSTAAAGGSITMTGGTLAGQALANTVVTMTGVNVVGCSALPVPPSGPPSTCKDKDRDHDGHDKDHKHHGHDKNKHHGNDGDKGHGSEANYPFGPKDKDHDKGDKGSKDSR